MTDTTTTEKEVARLRELLRRATRVAGVSNKEIEAKLKMSSGSLSRLFAGGIELKMKHVLDILRQIGMSPAEFFRLVFPLEEETGSETAIALKGFLGEGRTERTAPSRQRPAPAISEEEIENMVGKALRKLLLGADAK